MVGKLAAEKNFTERTRLSSSEFNQYSENQRIIEFSSRCFGLARTSEQFRRTYFYLQNHLNEELPVNLNKGNVIKSEVSEELDRLRNLQSKGKGFWMKCAKEKSKEREFLPWKIDFNNVFGYYIEVRNTHKDKVPEDWIRKQTLVNAERYITEELKEYETQILGAEEKFHQMRTSIVSSGLRKCDDVYWPNSRKF